MGVGVMGALTSRHGSITNLLLIGGADVLLNNSAERSLCGCRGKRYCKRENWVRQAVHCLSLSLSLVRDYKRAEKGVASESSGWSVVSTMTMRTHLFVCLFVHQQIILMKGVAWSVIAGQYPGCNSKLFKGEEVRSDTRSFLNLRFETAAIGHTGTKLQYRQPWRGEKHWFYLPHECLFVLLLIYINLNFKQIKIFHKFFNLFQSTWDRWNKTWIGRKAQSRMFWRAITTSSWGDELCSWTLLACLF